MNILVLYDDRSLETEFVRQHLEAIRAHSVHTIHYSAATYDAEPGAPLDMFDAIFIHFSVRLAFDWHLSPKFAKQIEHFRGTKILMIQDEYDMPAVACRWIRRLAIHTVFTCVPAEFRERFYPPGEVPGVRFVQVLTGYVPDELPDLSTIRPIAERPIWVGYRGRQLPVWYGSLAFEKLSIGVEMRSALQQRNIPCDIEWLEENRLGGTRWYDFLQNCRAVLGTESGSNVVDQNAEIREAVTKAKARNPKLSELVLYDTFVRPHDGLVRMNQISPKIFEAAALKTALVLFDGRYSDLIAPDEHFIPLRKDFSNIDVVVEKLKDSSALQAMVDRTHKALCQSGRFTYQSFVALLDDALHKTSPDPQTGSWTYIVARYQTSESDWRAVARNMPATRPIPYVLHPRAPITSGWTRRIWLSLPAGIRRVLSRLIDGFLHHRR